MAQLLELAETPPLVVQTRPVLDMDDDQFFRFCALNRGLRIERNAHGDILIMMPEGNASSLGNVELMYLLQDWARRDGTGRVYGASAGFKLPNGATRGPDVAWVRTERLVMLSDQEWQQFAPLCPDFVLELRSPSDSLRVLEEKMEEYRDNGARLGWLLDPQSKRVLVYRPGEPVEDLKDPSTVAGDPVLPGFVLDVRSIWRAMDRNTGQPS